MSETDKKELVKQMSDLKKDISEIKEKLNTTNSIKEETFSKKRELSEKIDILISKVKESKQKRDEKTIAVKEGKIKRQALNDEIKKKVDEIKKLQEKKDEIIKKAGPQKESPVILKKQIDALEYKIETEGMSFDKEQKTMKVINDLRKKLSHSTQGSEVFEDYKKIQKDLKTLKSQANQIHKQIQNDASESQKLHEAMINASKEIDELKKQEKELYSRFSEEKKTFIETNEKLKSKLQNIGRVKEEFTKHKISVHEDRKERENKTISEKKKEVEEKIRKGEKLTTDDLIVMQAGSDYDE